MLQLSHWSGRKMPQRTTERFLFFAELASVDLAKVRLYDGTLWLPQGVSAITLCVPLSSWLFGSTRIYFNARSRSGASHPDSPQGIELFAEELFHVKQQLERGATSFYAAYLWEYFQHRRRGLQHSAAYNAISFELEAKAFARDAARRAAVTDSEAA